MRIMKVTHWQGGPLFRRFLFTLSLLAMPMALPAMELNKFVADSITAHPTIREQVHIFRQVNSDRDIANSGWQPSVDLNGSTGSYDTQSPVTNQIKREYNSNRVELSVTQNLFNGFNTTYQKNKLRLELIRH